jgi:RHS repeat-associated protein
MTLDSRSRACTLLSVVTLTAFVGGMLPARSAHADPGSGIQIGTGGPATLAGPTPQAGAAAPLASVDLATGEARASFSFELPSARGQAQPSLGLSYSSASGVGFAGIGWSLDLPSIERRGASGMPRFDGDVLGSDPLADKYTFGGTALVPICTIGSGGGCNGLVRDEAIPPNLDGWTYFRTEVDDGRRFFYLPASGFGPSTWIVQTKGGVTLTFGTPREASPIGGADPTEWSHEPLAPASGVYRWNLARQTDTYGDAVYYQWYRPQTSVLGGVVGASGQGREHLEDIYDTMPAPTSSGGGIFGGGTVVNAPSAFAHHVHLAWTGFDPRTALLAQSPSWQTPPAGRLDHVDVTSAPFEGGTREIVRRYWLHYTLNPGNTQNHLDSIELEGTCGHQTENASGLLPTTTGCPRVSSLSMTYTPSQFGTGTTNGGLDQLFYQAALTGPYLLADANGDGVPELFSNLGAVPYIATGSGIKIQLGPTTGISPQFLVSDLFSSSGVLGNGEERFAMGDWVGDGRLNWLWFDINSYSSQNNHAFWTFTLDSTTSTMNEVVTAQLPSYPGTSPPTYFDFQAGRTMDVDGDGLTDEGFVIEGPGFENLNIRAYYTARDVSGLIHPVAQRSVQATCPNPVIWGAYGNNDAPTNLRVVADVDGDGLQDIVVIDNTVPSGASHFGYATAHVFKNRGDGRFGYGANPPVPCQNSAYASDDILIFTGDGIDNTSFLASAALHDVDGDGLADFVWVDPNGVWVVPQEWQPDASNPAGGTPIFGPTRINILPDQLGCSNLVSQSQMIPPYNPQQTQLLFADMNASGVDDVNVFACGSWTWFDLQGGTRPGLLASISNGVGMTTSLSYGDQGQLGIQGSIPVPIEVVSKVETTNGLTGPYGFDATTTYAYASPVYDARDRLFLGFQTVTAYQAAGSASDPTIDTVTHFATGTCAVNPGQPCPATPDYGYRIQRGLIAATEQMADAGSTTKSGSTLTTTINSYTYDTLYTGTDGRVVRQVYQSQRDVYLWDPLQQTSTPLTTNVLVEPNGPNVYAFPLTINVPPARGPNHLRHAFTVNKLGNTTAVTDYGSYGLDQIIQVSSVWNTPMGDATGWNYRLSQTQTAYSDGNGNLIPPIREADYLYNAQGLPTSVSSPLSGTRALQRANPGGETAPTPPPGASQNSAPTQPLTLLQMVYDPSFGNLTQVTGPNGQCAAVGYDKVFQQLPTATTQYTGGCGVGPLTTSRRYDRGLEKVIQELSASAQLSTATYDAFGRVLSLSAPDPGSALQSVSSPTLTIDYSLYDAPLPPATLSPPVRRAKVTTNVGTETQPVSRSVWSYFDGLGRELVQIEPSETSGSWVVHGGRVVGSVTGRTETAWRPFFQGLAAGSAYDVQGPTPSGPDETFTYDALGRVATTIDELQRTTKVTYHPTSLSRTVQDAEQALTGGPHGGASTTTSFDGHGRVASTSLTMANPAPDVITTAYGYLATSEVKNVTKSHSGGAGMFVRGLAYDSLGRLVENQEPNTSGAHDWLYAYDNSGRLVGTSDARGCGKNIAYDNLGRVVGEDYSPCDAAGPAVQPPYSAPESGSPTGAGYEVFNKYDVPETPEPFPAWYAGRLTATYDRAQHTQIELDGRGRVSAINRQVMAPDQLDYSPHVFRRQMSYDEANRVVSATTGADTPGLTAQAGSALSTAYTVRGGVSSVGMPYGGGKLLQQRQFDATNSPTSETYIGMAGPSQIISYYPDGALHELQTFPGASNGLAAVQDLLINYDLVDNPVAIVDQSTYSWPAGIEAASRGTLAQPITYDDAYRVTKVPTLYGPSGGATSPDVFSTGKAMPYAPEIAAGNESFPFTLPLANRVTGQWFGYDWLDNVQTADDDQHAAPDRSFGVASYPPTGPVNQLVSTAQNGTSIAATYDPAGNTTSVTVTQGPSTNGSCQGPCVTTYLYAWDEVGQMSNAARVEGATASSEQTRVRFAYTYDGGGTRVIRFEANEAQEDSGVVLSYDVNVFSTLRLETTSTPDGGDYEATDATEIVYLQDGAGQTYGRAFVSQAPGTTSGGPVRVYLEFGDHLGSTAAVVDAATGNIVERTSYLAFGGVDADYRPDSEGNFREPFRYTGHEDDSQVGLTYFGARYYIPTLARWASPDPLTIHGLGSSLNPYAFVRNSPLGNVDPFGLDEAGPPTQEPESPVPVSGGGSLCLFNCNSGGQGNGAGGGQPLGSPRGHGPTLQLTLTPWASSGADANKL